MSGSLHCLTSAGSSCSECPLWGPECAALYALKHNSACGVLGWGGQDFHMAPSSLRSKLLPVQVSLGGLEVCWVGRPGQVSLSSSAQS